MEKQSSILIRRDVSEDASLEITTYENIGGFMKYTTYKNDKPVAWASKIEYAMDNHQMYVNSRILKLGRELPDELLALKYYSVRKKDGIKRSNDYLHTFQPGQEEIMKTIDDFLKKH